MYITSHPAQASSLARPPPHSRQAPRPPFPPGRPPCSSPPRPRPLSRLRLQSRGPGATMPRRGGGGWQAPITRAEGEACGCCVGRGFPDSDVHGWAGACAVGCGGEGEAACPAGPEGPRGPRRSGSGRAGGGNERQGRQAGRPAGSGSGRCGPSESEWRSKSWQRVRNTGRRAGRAPARLTPKCDRCTGRQATVTWVPSCTSW